jgi:general secretion pathway protein G
MHANRNHRQAGFTLVELLVVILIISIVASIAIVALMNALDKARQRATMADMRTVSKAIEAYFVDHGHPPDDAGGAPALAPLLIPYQTNVVPMRDRWTHVLAYQSDPTSGEYSIESLGKDGIDGADISYASRMDFNLDIVLANGIFVSAPE